MLSVPPPPDSRPRIKYSIITMETILQSFLLYVTLYKWHNMQDACIKCICIVISWDN